LFWSLVVLRAPIVLYPSGDAAQWRRTLTFALPPDRVVYEEDPTRAARLASLPPDPRAAYIGDPNRPAPPAYYPQPAGGYWMGSSDGQPYAEYLPPFYRRMYMGIMPRGLIFIHGRTGQRGRQRLVHVTQERSYAYRPPLRPHALNVRDGLELTACTSSADAEFSPGHGNTKHSIFLPLGFGQVARIYAGQADPTDLARVTIRYEIDGVPGTIEGRLDDWDDLVLRVLDGPAAGAWRPVPGR
jgi:hypothetical protein